MLQLIRQTIPPASRYVGPAALALALLLVADAPSRAAVETGRPYLKRPATTPRALVGQVETDRQLMARYAKHFGASPVTILRAFRRARGIVLPPGRYTVWLTGRDGLRYPTVQDRTRETQVFLVALPFERDPTAWLETGTGNPIQVFRPVEEVEVIVETPTTMVTESEVPKEVLVPVQTAQPGRAARPQKPNPEVTPGEHAEPDPPSPTSAPASAPDRASDSTTDAPAPDPDRAPGS